MVGTTSEGEASGKVQIASRTGRDATPPRAASRREPVLLFFRRSIPSAVSGVCCSARSSVSPGAPGASRRGARGVFLFREYILFSRCAVPLSASTAR